MTDNTAFPTLRQRSFGTSRIPIHDWATSCNSQNLDDTTRSVRSLYLHIPFCFHKCHYCDFYSIVDRLDRQEVFADRLIEEIKAQAGATGSPTLETIFIGGGTPTLLEPKLLARVLDSIQSEFNLAESLEWTIESNPETLTDEICSVLKDSAVNRISMGAQSFNTTHLKTLERHHDPQSVIRSAHRAKEAGFVRLSIDLIYAIPEQTLDQWEDDLKQAFQLPIDHLSAYALTYEPNTAMTARLKKGAFEAAPDELEVAMYNTTLDYIQHHGMQRYEVSNHALPGSECQHNIAYWKNNSWLAIGPSASGHLDGYRWKNTPRLEEYISTNDQGFAPICELETPDPRRMMMDTIMMGIRMRDGLERLPLTHAAAQFGTLNQLIEAIEECCQEGWLQHSGDRLILTELGYHFADRVARELLGPFIPDDN
jgi:oxygen-independent coproporphyrinogen III oxidase